MKQERIQFTKTKEEMRKKKKVEKKVGKPEVDKELNSLNAFLLEQSQRDRKDVLIASPTSDPTLVWVANHLADAFVDEFRRRVTDATIKQEEVSANLHRFVIRRKKASVDEST